MVSGNTHTSHIHININNIMKAMHHAHASKKLRMGLFLKALLLLCLVQHSVPFGMAGSEIRANRAPISCLSASETRRYGASSGSSGSAVDKDADGKEKAQLDQNTKYIEGLIRTLDTLLEQWIISGAMATVSRCFIYDV